MITLLTDFGLRAPYVAAMKAVILRIAPDVRIIDISHQIKRFDVLEGAFVLYSVYRYFPAGTIHVGVVDPGVGGKREPLIIETERYYFVGPNNGLLSLAALEDGIRRAFRITYSLPRVSRTFHGRDIFAPTAAMLANGIDPELLGVEIDREKLVKVAMEARIEEGFAEGQIVYVDDFGNLVTNIRAEDLGFEPGRRARVWVEGVGEIELPCVGSYEEVPEGELLLIEDSFEMIEISANRDSAAKRLGVGRGSKVRIELL